MTHETADFEVPSDEEIARTATLDDIETVAARLGLGPDDIEPYGSNKAKLRQEAVDAARERGRNGSLVLVTGITPTPKGEGKTVISVGLAQGLARLGEDVAVAVREPSLGPVFGIKGGAAGGGYSQVLPMEDINLHFTGDIHALTAAHNLISAMLDAHVHHGNDLEIDVDQITWRRSLDVNDRALRETVVGLGGSANGPPREDGFGITAASELMAVLCLASDLADLKRRVARIVVATDRDGTPVTVDDIGATGAVSALLRDALRPNLVQTLEGVPAFVHGGPFANIAHGTNTLVADEVGLAHTDYLVTEAGFGADLGAEKFLDIVSREGAAPEAVVVVATVRGLKRHGLDMWPANFDVLATPNPDAVRDGLPNLFHHVSVLRDFGLPVVVAVNRFPDDTDAEVAAILDACATREIPASVSTAHAEGGRGAEELAELVRQQVSSGRADLQLTYDLDDSLREKITAVATHVYGANDVTFSKQAEKDLNRLVEHGFDSLPVCLSKTPYSLSDDASKTGVPTDWTLHVRELYPAAGAGFVVALTGDVMTMPGLPARPAAVDIDVDDDGTIHGLF
ncbi:MULTISPECIES: formate--tetrahydrofolate ligase [Haloferax]|uniref:Formate--tetrahydrofolate ligase n=2 Tax=Haloferax TaxID=2251 RepID=A0A6G1Z2B8_9EURY|nr:MULTISPECIES: formate--tetrahydrofolate ligase [Haloferax]KAB1188016.1 formate--tetrahydrofolate ligase [Haloferax sp. CBA1149]MRW80686.1 formate--tetrahydrofolate ligase [Haloferax marinisediminis]